MAANTVSASLNYFQPPLDDSKPWIEVDIDPKTGDRRTNFSQEKRQFEIENVRGRENEYNLDTTGFRFHKHISSFKNFDDEEAIKKEYYNESIHLIKEVTGANRVVIFDHSMIFCLAPP